MIYTYSCVRNPKARTWTKFYGCFGNDTSVLVSISFNGRVVVDTSCMYVDLKSKNIAGSKKRFDNAYAIATRRVKSAISSPQ
jgi:hypothetical protein